MMKSFEQIVALLNFWLPSEKTQICDDKVQQYLHRDYVFVRKLFWIESLVFRLIFPYCQMKAVESAVEV